MFASIAILLLLNNALSDANVINNYDDYKMFASGRLPIEIEGPQHGSRFKRDLNAIVKPVETYAVQKETELGKKTPVRRPNEINSVVSYASKMINSPTKGTIELPHVVRAVITRDTVLPANSRTAAAISREATDNCYLMGMHGGSNPDQLGHFIAFKNGGPADRYNFAPQSKMMNLGIKKYSNQKHASSWTETEKGITEFVQETNGKVEMTVVAYYDGDGTRPVAFGVAEKDYRADGTLAMTHPDTYYANDQSVDIDLD